MCPVCECCRYLALQEEEHQHADEVPVGAAPAAPFSQRLFGLRVVAAEQPERKKRTAGRRGWERGGGGGGGYQRKTPQGLKQAEAKRRKVRGLTSCAGTPRLPRPPACVPSTPGDRRSRSPRWTGRPRCPCRTSPPSSDQSALRFGSGRGLRTDCEIVLTAG